jgi:hypothetical protein
MHDEPVTADERVIVSGPPTLIGALRSVFLADPEVTVDGAGGPPTTPERLVLRMPTARATALSTALGPAVQVELDIPLPPPTPAFPALDVPRPWS